MSDPIRFFVNARPVDGERGDTVLDAITRNDAAMGEALRTGARALTDSRGLVTSLEQPIYSGAIYRVVSNRQLREHDDPFADA